MNYISGPNLQNETNESLLLFIYQNNEGLRGRITSSGMYRTENCNLILQQK